MNRARIKQIFIELATKVSTAVDSGAPITPPPGPINDTFVMRNNLVLYGELARAYVESVYEAGSLAIVDSSWSRDTIDDLFATHLAAVLERDATDRDVPGQAASVYNELGLSPQIFELKLSVFGLDPLFLGFEFGLIQIERQMYTPPVNFGPFLVADTPIALHFAHCSVSAQDRQSANLRASELVEKHLAVLNALFSSGSSSKTFLTHKFVGNFDFLVTAEKDEAGEWSTSPASERVRLPISKQDVDQYFERRAGRRVSNLLQAETDLADRITTAFELAGNACVEPTPHTAFLLFAIALESAVLGRETQSELVHQLATRTAHLLCRSMTSKKITYAAVKRLYGIRSKIVHTGNRDLSNRDVEEIRQLCLTSLLTLSASEAMASFTTSKELEDWFQEKLLESDPAT